MNSNLKNRDSFYKIFKEMYQNLIECSSNEFPNDSEKSSLQSEWGNIRKNFSKHIKTRFNSEFGDEGQDVIFLSDDEIKQKLNKLSNEVNEYTKLKREGNLGEYRYELIRLNKSKNLTINF